MVKFFERGIANLKQILTQFIISDSCDIDHTKKIWGLHLFNCRVFGEVTSSLQEMPSWSSCCLLDMNCTRLSSRGIFSLNRLLMISKQHGMFALLGNIGVVSATSLLMRFATLSSMQAIRKACWSVRGSTRRLEEAWNALNLCFHLLGSRYLGLRQMRACLA